MAHKCDSVLINKNLTVVKENSLVRLHAFNMIASSRSQEDAKDFYGMTGDGVFDFSSFEKETNELNELNKYEYSRDHSLSIVQYHMASDAVENWARCMESDRQISQFFCTLGRSTDKEANLFIYWYPSLDIGGDAITVNTPTFEVMPKLRKGERLKPGKHVYKLRRNSEAETVIGGLSGTVGKATYAFEVFWPRRQKIVTRYYVSQNDLVSAHVRDGGGQPIFLDRGQYVNVVNQGPPPQGLSHATFRVPDGARAFQTQILPGPGAAYVYVNADGIRMRTAAWPSTRQLDIALPDGTKELTIGADALGTAWGDECIFVNLRFEIEKYPD